MKLGILTFHSQLNYGGVLRCWELLTPLKGIGRNIALRAENLHALTFNGRKWYNVGS